MKRNQWILIGFCGLMVLSALFSAVHRKSSPGDESSVEIPETRFSPRQRRPVSGDNPARDFGDAIADAIEKVMPSVVVIQTEKVQQKKVPGDPFGFTWRWAKESLEGEGSGVIIDERGYIITSWHVISGAEWIEVILHDGTKLPATEVGHDRSTDLAVLKVEGKGMSCPTVEFGDSDAVRVGEVAIAIGSPFSLQSSATVGHVSQKGRRVQILPYEDFIQTDAAINEGNSGGPLIDVDGRLIGINAAIQTEAQKKGVGIAFAIPANLSMVVARSIIETGKHEWPWVGASFGKEGNAGDLLVTQVWRDTPAARAGLLPGDTVRKVNGINVYNQYDVYRVIFNHSVGEKVRFTIERDKKKQPEVELLLEEFPGTP